MKKKREKKLSVMKKNSQKYRKTIIDDKKREERVGTKKIVWEKTNRKTVSDENSEIKNKEAVMFEKKE